MYWMVCTRVARATRTSRRAGRAPRRGDTVAPMHTTTFAALLVLAVASCASPPALTYDDVAGHPREERLTAMNAASPEEMAALFRTHVEHVAARPDVTADERATLARVAALVSPEWSAADAPSERAEADEAEAERLIRGLSPATMRAVMALGGESP